MDNESRVPCTNARAHTTPTFFGKILFRSIHIKTYNIQRVFFQSTHTHEHTPTPFPQMKGRTDLFAKQGNGWLYSQDACVAQRTAHDSQDARVVQRTYIHTCVPSSSENMRKCREKFESCRTTDRHHKTMAKQNSSSLSSDESLLLYYYCCNHHRQLRRFTPQKRSVIRNERCGNRHKTLGSTCCFY